MKTFELMETKLAESTFLSAMIFNFCQDFHIILRIIAFWLFFIKLSAFLNSVVVNWTAIILQTTFLGDVGGRKLDEVVRRIMTQLLDSDLAIKFNMIDSKGKMPVGTSKLFKVIFSIYVIKKRCTFMQ